MPSLRIARGPVEDRPDAQRGKGTDAATRTTSQERHPAVDAGDVGAALRAAREKRDVPLDDVARLTKIRIGILRAIETNRRDALPPDIYLRGFVRAYASAVGLGPDDTATRYLDQFAPVDTVPQDACTPEPHERESPQPLAMDNRGHTLRMQWLVILVLLVAWAGYSISRRQTPTVPASQTSQSDQPADAARSAAADRTPEAREIGTVGAMTAVDGMLHLSVQATGPCWVAATVDGTRAIYGLMRAGEQQGLDIRREAVLRVGDPAAFAFTINGAPGRALGQAGEPVTARITSENYRDFLHR